MISLAYLAVLSKQIHIWGSGKEQIALFALLFFLAGLRMGYLGFCIPKNRGIVIQNGNLGQVKVSFRAVENLIYKLMRPLSEVKEVSSSLKEKKGELFIKLRLNVMPETNLPQLSERIQTLLENGIGDILGVKVGQVKILVQKMTTETARVE